uniref:Uncharacterized protein n=1 Tax=Photinus pyralis TaxID=7054 RepID=A0A1Y1LYY2_PHOPY
MLGKDWANIVLTPDCNTSFVGPGTSDIPRCVASSTEKNKRKPNFLAKLDASAVALDLKIKTAKPVTGKRISTTLQRNGAGTEFFNNFANDRIKKHVVLLISDAVVEWHIYSVMSSWIMLVFGAVVI